MVHHDSSSKNHTCPVQSLSDNATEDFLGQMTFYQFNVILSGACTAFSALVIFILMFMHGVRLSKPNEQIKIFKIAFFIPSFALISFIGIVSPKTNVYIAPWVDVFESVALCCFFLLLCEYVSPDKTQREMFFAALLVKNKKVPGGMAEPKGGAMHWYRQRWFMLFQYPVVAVLAAILTDITQAAGIYCDFESKPYFAMLWINLATTASLLLAIMSVLKFYGALKVTLAGYHPLQKLLAFKLIVFTTFIEKIVWWILGAVHGVLDPTAKMTYADLNIGIKNMIICVEMVPFALFFHYAYSVRPYIIHSIPQSEAGETGGPRSYQGGYLGYRAWLGALNPMQMLQAIAFAFQSWSDDKVSPRGDSSYGLVERQPPVYNEWK